MYWTLMEILIKRNLLYKIVGLPDNEIKAIVKLFTGVKSLNVTSVLKCTFIQIFIHFPGLYSQANRELREDCKGWEGCNNKTVNREHVHF
jgi:hypothetical protein